MLSFNRSPSVHVRYPGVALVVALCWACSAAAQWTSDPVAEVRQTLKSSVQDVAARDRDLRKQILAVQGPSDLRRALLLQEWRDDDVDADVRVIDQLYRSVVAGRFEQAVRGVLQHGDTNGKLAIVNMLGEIGVTARGVGTTNGVVHGMGPDLALLIQQGEPAVREAAARALGQINPDPDVAVPALSSLLGAADVAQRRAAADGLVGLMRVVSRLVTASSSTKGVQVTRRDVVRTGCAVVPAACRGLADPQAEVRRRCAAAIEEAATVLGKLLQGERSPLDEPLADDSRSQLAQERAELLPLIAVLSSQGAVLARALEDKDAEVRLLSRRAVEDLARVPPPAAAEPIQRATYSPASAAPEESLAAWLQAKLPALAVAVTDPDVRARRAAIDVLESLGPAAAPAAPALVKALADSDRFVRWAAARTLGRLGPVEVGTSVPGLARLLSDPDLDVRLAAATALEHYGPRARAAVPALVEAAKARDAEMRVAVIRVLAGMGTDAQAAVPTLGAALADPDARVRQGAAVALGRVGPGARAAAPALRQALGDGSDDVRKAAGDALLAMQGSGTTNRQ